MGIMSHCEKYTAEGAGRVTLGRGCWGTWRLLGATRNSLKDIQGNNGVGGVNC